MWVVPICPLVAAQCDWEQSNWQLAYKRYRRGRPVVPKTDCPLSCALLHSTADWRIFTVEAQTARNLSVNFNLVLLDCATFSFGPAKGDSRRECTQDWRMPDEMRLYVKH